MEIYGEPKDPTELKDYEFDWSAQLGEGETVISQVVSFVDAAGTGNPQNSLATPYSRIWLSGGNNGSRVVYTIKAVTSGGRELEVALGVNIVDSTTLPTDLDTLRADLAEVESAIRRFVKGEFIKDVWRDGRRLVRENPTYKNLLDEKGRLECAIDAAEAVASGGRRRRAIALAWPV